MLPRLHSTPAFLVAALILSTSSAFSQVSGLQEQRIGASFVLALGRTPTPAEMGRWTTPEPQSLNDLIARHRRDLQADSAAQRVVVDKARLDAFGPAPGGGSEAPAAAGTYAELMLGHLRRLTAQPADYEQVIHRAYRMLLARDAYPEEIDYWRQRPTLSFALLVACVEDWARRNRPGLMATTGVPTVSINSEYLATVRLSPAIAAEARTAIGLPPMADEGLAAAAGRTLVAPGGDQVESVGGIYFTAAGASELAARCRAALK